MPRGSRHKSHKQSRHSSKENREYSDSDSDVKMKETNGKEEVSAKTSRDSASGEKRKFASQSRDGKEGKNMSGHGNGIAEAPEEYISSKRRKEKADGNGGDRWNSGGNEQGDGVAAEKVIKGESSRIDSEKGYRSKVLIDSKRSSSKRNDTDEMEEKDDSKNSNNRVDSKRRSERDSGRKQGQHYKESQELMDKERGSDKERKLVDVKHDNTEAHEADGKVTRKQGSQPVDAVENRASKRVREITELHVQDELRNPELEKELEKRIQRRRDGSIDKYDGSVRETDDRRLSSKAGRARDGRYKDGSSGDKYREDGDKNKRYRDDKYHEDGEKYDRHWDAKYHDDGERESRRKDSKYHEDGGRESRRRDDKYHEDGGRESRRRDDKYHEDGGRQSRRRDDKYHEDDHRDNRHRDDQYGEDGDRNNRHRDDRHHDDGVRNSKHKDGKYREVGDIYDRHRENKYHEDSGKDKRLNDRKYHEDSDRDTSHKEEKHREDVDSYSRHKDGGQGDDIDLEKRLRDVECKDERISRDRASDKCDTKRLKDETSAADRHHRKSNNHDGSPSYDDRFTRYKDDQGRRSASAKEEHSGIRSRSNKVQRFDAEKRSMSSGKADVTDKGRSNSSWTADVELTFNHSRHRSSPSSSSHAARDHDRLSKQEESKHKDYTYEDRLRHDGNSGRDFSGVAGGIEKIVLSRSAEKPIKKDDSHFEDLSADWRKKSEARASPLQLVDTSSTGTDCRHLNGSDARRSLDVEELRQRSGGSKDVKDYSCKEGRRSRDLPRESVHVDELSQADGDSLSVSSPFPRTGHFYGNSKSLLPPPTSFKMGVDSPSMFGSSEEDIRTKSNNRHRRMGDPSMGRGQGSAWKGVPNWPSPMPNGFMPFQHGPPPVGFHPVMQQFRAPPLFGVRPPMEMNHAGVPYHLSDADRFTGHGRPIGWRNPVDDSCPPLRVWGSSNPMFGDETQIYGTLDWDNNRNIMNSRGWETSGDMWKGQIRGASVELSSASHKDDSSARGPHDEVWSGWSEQQAQNEQNQPELQAESIDISQSSDANERKTPEAPKAILEESPGISKLSEKDDALFCQVYLSKLDISVDLAQPELYVQCRDLLDMDQNTISDEDDAKVLGVEVVEAKVRIPDRTPCASLFAAIDDTVFQKAMSLYKKQKEEIGSIIEDNVSIYSVKSVDFVATAHQEMTAGRNDARELSPACDQQDGEGADLNSNSEGAELPIIQNQDEPAMVFQKPEEPISISSKGNVDFEPVSNPETLENVLEGRSSYLENVGGTDALSPRTVENVNGSGGSGGNCLANNKDEQKLLDTDSGLHFYDASSEACDSVMPVSVESGSLNLSRIHHSPESTH